MENNIKSAVETTDTNPIIAQTEGFNRRSFLAKAALMGGAALGAAALPSLGMANPFGRQGTGPTDGDIDILYFLAAAELVEDDLWSQYSELAINNPDFRLALRRIDPSLPAYITQDRDDERSHAMSINAYLKFIGLTPLNLDDFRTIMPPKVRGIEQRGRLCNLTNLKVDTSWYNRYRGTGNPDFNDTFPQLVTINDKPTIPLSDNLSNNEVQIVAHAAAFHFGAIEQGGAQLYNGLISRTVGRDALSIVASIGPTEFYHFAVFQTALEGIFAISGNGLSFPNLKGNTSLSEKVMPAPCKFLNASFPNCSVVRPRSKANSGATAAALGLAGSGLFTGQSQAFFDAVVGLATKCDAANGF